MVAISTTMMDWREPMKRGISILEYALIEYLRDKSVRKVINEDGGWGAAHGKVTVAALKTGVMPTAFGEEVCEALEVNRTRR